MINWIEITEEEYQKHQDEDVLAVNSSRSSIIGCIVQDARYNGFTCENDRGYYITDITHFIPVHTVIEELLKTLPNKKKP
jgi:hypothetical protein